LLAGQGAILSIQRYDSEKKGKVITEYSRRLPAVKALLECNEA
jgi:hypothetical protein